MIDVPLYIFIIVYVKCCLSYLVQKNGEEGGFPYIDPDLYHKRIFI